MKPVLAVETIEIRALEMNVSLQGGVGFAIEAPPGQ
jgi:hypothetical protein